MRKVQVFVEFRGHPDFSCFVTTVVWLVPGCMVRFPRGVFEKCSNCVEKIFLVVLGCEMVMSVSFLNKIFGQLTLGQQSVGGDGFALDI